MIVTSLKAFLCHGSNDKADIRDLYTKLLRDGFLPWLDEEHLLPGDDWDAAIRAAVRTSDVVLVCLSGKSVNRSGYLQREIKFALDIALEKPFGAVFIIPVRLDATVLPEELTRWHWVDLFSDGGYERLRKALVQKYAKTLHRDQSMCRFYLAKVINSSTFSRAAQLRVFLGWLGDRSLDQPLVEPTEEEIAAQVFRREVFDPKMDRIVETELIRLHEKLALYYRSEGKDDFVTLTIAGDFFLNFEESVGRQSDETS